MATRIIINLLRRYHLLITGLESIRWKNRYLVVYALDIGCYLTNGEEKVQVNCNGKVEKDCRGGI